MNNDDLEMKRLEEKLENLFAEEKAKRDEESFQRVKKRMEAKFGPVETWKDADAMANLEYRVWMAEQYDSLFYWLVRGTNLALSNGDWSGINGSILGFDTNPYNKEIIRGIAKEIVEEFQDIEKGDEVTEDDEFDLAHAMYVANIDQLLANDQKHMKMSTFFELCYLRCVSDQTIQMITKYTPEEIKSYREELQFMFDFRDKLDPEDDIFSEFGFPRKEGVK